MAENTNVKHGLSTNTNTNTNEDDELTLMSLEKLDRESPDLWPEKIPGVTDFISMNNTPPIQVTPPAWSAGLTHEDINAMHQLGALSTTGIVHEIKKLYDQAYQLGVQEAKEMTRGKYLNIFTNPKQK